MMRYSGFPKHLKMHLYEDKKYRNKYLKFFILIDFIFMKVRTFQSYVLLLDHQEK